MKIAFTREEIERCERMMQNPFASNSVRFAVYVQPATNDSGLFQHGTDWVPCSGCVADPFGGGELWEHVHLVVNGSNGGVRCFPFDDGVKLLSDLYSRLSLACISNDDDQIVRVGFLNVEGTPVMSLPISTAAAIVLSGDSSSLRTLLEMGMLFPADTEDGS